MLHLEVPIVNFGTGNFSEDFFFWSIVIDFLLDDVLLHVRVDLLL